MSIDPRNETVLSENSQNPTMTSSAARAGVTSAIKVATTENPNTNNAVIPATTPLKKIVIIERIVQKVPDNPTPDNVKDMYLPEDGSSWGIQPDYSKKKYWVRSEAEQKKADTIFLHYTGTSVSSKTDRPKGIGDMNYLVAGNTEVSAHFSVLGNGRIVQLFYFDKRTHTQGDNLRGTYNYEIGEARSDNPNAYSYSMEIASGDMQGGALTSGQIQAVVFLIRYIKKMAYKLYGVVITTNRIWRGYPDFPDPSDEYSLKGKDGNDLKDGDDNVKKTRDRFFRNVYGHLIGHIEAASTSCPGYLFNWEAILIGLGVYPESEEDKTEMKKKVSDFYDSVDKMTVEEKKKIADYSLEYNEIGTSNLPEYHKYQILPKNEVPYYYNSQKYLQHDDIEFVVWYRTLDKAIKEADYDVAAKRTVGGKETLSLRDEYLQSLKDNSGNQRFPEGTYEVLA